MATILRSKSSCDTKPIRLPISKSPAYWGFLARSALFSACLAATAVAPLPGFAAPGTITSLFSFNGTNGALPRATLTPRPGGGLYGTTASGGANDSGTIFSFDGNSITTLASFNGTNGATPFAALTAGTGGVFYGTTQIGGASNKGTVYSFDGTSITSFTSFAGTNGAFPYVALTPRIGGGFYGTTPNGGANGGGTVYSFDGTSITSLASFDGTTIGNQPFAALTPGPGGVFYGTTAFNGAPNFKGTVYSFDGTSITSLVSFDGTNGATPVALTAGTGGVFYGTTANGGANDSGTIFSFDGTSVTTLASFDGTNGDGPVAALTAGTGGIFYGTTQFGGASNNGTIFSFDSNSNSITSLASFDGTNGSQPFGALTAGPDGIFYGTTFRGGADDKGTVYSFGASAAPVPGPLPIFGIAAAFGYSRKLRKRIKSSKPDVIPTI